MEYAFMQQPSHISLSSLESFFFFFFASPFHVVPKLSIRMFVSIFPISASILSGSSYLFTIFIICEAYLFEISSYFFHPYLLE